MFIPPHSIYKNFVHKCASNPNIFDVDQKQQLQDNTSTSKKSSNPWVVEAIKEMRPFTLVTWDEDKLNPIAVFNSTRIV